MIYIWLSIHTSHLNMYNHTNEIDIHWTLDLCVVYVCIKCGTFLSLEWSFNDQFNQVIHNWYQVKWSISIIEMNIYDLPQEWLHNFWSFSFGYFTIHSIWSFFICTSLFEIDAWIFDISFLWVSHWLFGHHTFQYKSLSLFPSQILVCAMTFATHYLFSRFEICWAIR